MKKIETAYFGGGCFWCTEAIFSNLKGVIAVIPGYAGGKLENPSYLDVSSGKTGHAEVIKIEFDSNIINYADLLEVFWHTHNPTTLNRQGNDIGSQYRSIILFNSAEQRKIAENSLKNLVKSREFENPVVTEIKLLDKFFLAENYHRNYYETHPDDAYCQIIISPKLQHLREKYSNKLKT